LGALKKRERINAGTPVTDASGAVIFYNAPAGKLS
jgi:hypothetical protein